MRKAGDVCFSEVYREGGGTIGIVDYTNYDDMKYAIKKLDDTEFRNAFGRAYIRVKEYDGKRGRSYSRSRSPSRSYSRSRSPSKSPRARRSASRSRSRSVSSRSRSASKGRSPSSTLVPSIKRTQLYSQTQLSRRLIWDCAAIWGLRIRILRMGFSQFATIQLVL
jgi:hypothetical protein